MSRIALTLVVCVVAIILFSAIVQAAVYEGGEGSHTECADRCETAYAEARVELKDGGSVKADMYGSADSASPTAPLDRTTLTCRGVWGNGEIDITGGGYWNCSGGGYYDHEYIYELDVECNDGKTTHTYAVYDIPRKNPEQGVQITVDVRDVDGNPVHPLGMEWGTRWPTSFSGKCDTDKTGRFTFILPSEVEYYQLRTWTFLKDYHAFSRIYDCTETYVIITMVPRSYGEYSNVTSTRGLVEYMAPGSDTWVPIAIGADILPGGKLRTMDDSWALIQVTGRSIVRMAPFTELILEKKKKEDGKKTLIDLIKGSLGIVDDSDSEFELKTTACAPCVKGTVFRYKTHDGEDFVELVEGQLELTPTGGGAPTLLETGEKAEIKNGQVTVEDMSWDEEVAVVEDMEDLLRMASTEWEEPQRTHWGVYNAFCCPDGDRITFKVTLDGATKMSTGGDCSEDSTWEGYAETTANMLQVYEWSVSNRLWIEFVRQAGLQLQAIRHLLFLRC